MKYAKVGTEQNDEYMSKNPIVVLMHLRFLSTIRSCVESIDRPRILDVGCGEGVVTNFLVNQGSVKPDQIVGLDIKSDCLRIASAINPQVQFHQGSVYELPFEDNSFDLVLALEVLEHLEFPSKAIEELSRVSKNWVIISVPNDPLFQLGNILRLKYLSSWGQNPDHIQHWTKRTFTRLITRYLRVVKVKSPSLVWLVFVCQAKKQAKSAVVDMGKEYHEEG